MRERAKAEFKGILIGDSARVSSVVEKFRGKINHEKFLRVGGGLQKMRDNVNFHQSHPRRPHSGKRSRDAIS
jgi:hypothetical protein